VTARAYPFSLPVVVPAFYVPVLGEKIVNAGMWNHLSRDMQQRVHNAWSERQPLTISKADLDAISDADWAVVQKNLG
jgi:hypothetical protein